MKLSHILIAVSTLVSFPSVGSSQQRPPLSRSEGKIILMEVKRIDGYGPTTGRVNFVQLEKSGKVFFNGDEIVKLHPHYTKILEEAITRQRIGPLYDPNAPVCLPGIPCVVPVTKDSETFQCGIGKKIRSVNTYATVRIESGRTRIMRDLSPVIIDACDDLTEMLWQELRR